MEDFDDKKDSEFLSDNVGKVNSYSKPSDPKPLSSLGRLLDRRDELAKKKFTPSHNDDANVRSYLSSPLDNDWKAQSSVDILKKLVG
jgi:hypothetical protein